MNTSSVIKEKNPAGELQKANDVIGQFITSCSHSMRGPLKSIYGLVNLIRVTPREDKNSDVFLDLITQVTDKMEHQLDEIEHFLENTRRDVANHEVINFNEIINNLLVRNKHEIMAHGILISFDVMSEGEFKGDRQRIALCVKNLFENSLQFRRVGEGVKTTIKIDVHVTPKLCTISVKDNGIGIPAEFHDQIFNLFFRASTQSKGTGIGLYVVRETVQKMHGGVTVSSSPERGSIFTITLPNCK